MPLEIVEALSTSDAVVFLASKSLLQNHDRLPSFSSLKKAVVDNNDIYAIDFSDTVGMKYESEVRKIVQKKLAVSFKCDLLIITKFKNSVMFTPIEDKHSLDDGNMISLPELQEHLKVLSENKMRKAGIFFLLAIFFIIYKQFGLETFTLRKKCPYSELFWSVFFRIRSTMEGYGISFRIQFECGKIQTRIIPNTDTFHAVLSK